MAVNIEEITDQGLRNPASKPVYQLPVSEVDVPDMVSRAQTRLTKLKRQAVDVALSSSIWQEEFPSLKYFDHLRIEYKGYSRGGKPVDVIDRKTGAVNIPTTHIATSLLGEFFTPLRTRCIDDFSQLRGLTYYVSLDFSKATPAKKLAVMTKDIEEGIDILSSVERKHLTAVDFLLSLGILDHLKSHTLTAFHALTFHEREGLLPEDPTYKEVRREAQRLMFTVTRAYQQAFLGQAFDSEFNPSNIKSSLERTADYIVGSNHSAEHFTYPEVANPFVILLGAHEAARRKGFPDLILGIPSGGTEVAIASHFMYENLYPNIKPPEIAFIPLSFHYRSQGGINHELLVDILRSSINIAGKSVLIVDDNSNTGSTLQKMAEAAVVAGASKVSAHIAEIDPFRITSKHNKVDGLHFGVVNMDHPDLETAMGISLTSDQNGDDLRRRELLGFVRHAHRKIEKATTRNGV